MSMRLVPALAFLLLAAPPMATAAPATPEEAQRLTALFERFVGRPNEQGSVVKVVPDGDAYRASLDLGRLFGFLQATGLTVTAGPVTALLEPRAGGQWHVAVDGLPEVGFARGGQASSVVFNGYKLDGLFDPALQAFASAATQAGGSTSHATGPKGSSTVRFSGSNLGSSTATDGGAGTVNVTTSQSIRDFRYDVAVAPAAGSPAPEGQPVDVTVQGATVDATLAMGQARNAALLDLWAFLVDHSSKGEIAADQAAFKAKLKAVLPPASSAVGDIVLSKLAVTTSLGAFGVADVSEHYELNGPAVKDGFSSRLKVAGLTWPLGLFPAWAAPLAPTGLDVAQTYGPFDLTPALLKLVDELDLTAPKPLTDEQLAAAKDSLGAGDRMIRIAPSTVSTALATLRFEGDVRVARPLPTGSASISVTGLDRTIDQIRAVSPGDPNAAQAIGLLSSLKVLAKAEGADSYSWRIEAAPGGNLTVNGNPLGGAAKPAPRKKAGTPP